MFRTIRRIIRWCGDFRKRLYISFFFSFLSGLSAAAPAIYTGYIIGNVVQWRAGDFSVPSGLWLQSLGVIFATILLRFLLDYMKARFQETISYELVARDRLAIGTALKRVSLGYFQEKDTGTVLNSITTGLYTLENMGMRMIDSFVGGYLSFFCIFILLFVIHPFGALICLAGVLLSFLCLSLISRYSKRNTLVQTGVNEKLTRAAVEYTRGLPMVKSFGMEGASFSAFRKACIEARKIALKIEWGFIPFNCLHLLALKAAGIVMIISVMTAGLSGNLSLPMVLAFSLLSLTVFNSLEPIADSAHILSLINNAMDQIEALSPDNYIDEDGKVISLSRYDIHFEQVRFSYDKGNEKRNVIKDVSFKAEEGTTTAIVGPSGSGKTTLCRLLARFYDVNGGRITLGGHNLKEFTCDSLLSNISMVFQNVYLFHDTVRTNICFGTEQASEEEMIRAAKQARCHDFIMALPEGYDTVIEEGGSTLSGGENQRISIARAILKNAPVVILDEATASLDPENEHLIQEALTELTVGKTVIVIAHRLATIENADQILVINDGHIVQKGTHRQLAGQEGLYQRFIKLRKQAEGWSIV
ncbi:ABC transporter, ATP-binding protein [Catonella morbi ATCC 51271]|uniref:ABC transporter, ATP-binding protein n=1 Tax=Catonella morbi ATCC 51271 TaxID=592026 RepID=V2Y323_9FIRM|nr:ABC transporter ATP-binding protein [Catonella morbi]ESL02467.1 ABC transporter, ATP-binding protein [Catonella morbi ATCC 51271]